MKYRAGKIKREHSVIEKVWPVLEQIAQCTLIDSIIPGPISPQNSKGFEVTFQRFTDTGLRLLAKNGSAVQEIYVVSAQKESTLAWLAEQHIVDWKPEPPPRPKTAAPEPAVRVKTVTLPSETFCATCGRLIAAGSRAVQLGRKHYHYVHVRCAK
ncbi:MAG TPA: DUF2103 domain-containing protein [Symbiobacteriaceae bacterium]|nr:DUF2103 domain-containing protein [Symbiobacteriaceae bacterium]